jgi:hypothetical protein
MSLDDLSPTEYFGPDAMNWVHPVTGKQHSLSPAAYAEAERSKEAYFHALESREHAPRCSIERTGRCICEYLSQWETAAEAELTVNKTLRAPEIRYGEPPAGGIDPDDIPPGGVLYVPEEFKNTGIPFTLDMVGSIPPSSNRHPLTGNGYDDLFTLGNAGEVIPLDRLKEITDARAQNLAVQESHRADAWRTTAVLMLITVLCLALGVTGRELGWY